MTIDQVEGNEPIHENFGTQLGNEIDEVSVRSESAYFWGTYVYRDRYCVHLLSLTIVAPPHDLCFLR